VLAAACATPSTTTAPAAPKLVVFLVVDGLPQRQVVDYRDQLAPDGLRRFLDRGAWFSEAHYGRAFTVTAAGHATMLTGAYPHRTGIIGNDWRDPATGEAVYCTGDAAYTYIGHQTAKLDGTSPKNLKVETVGDVLKRMNPASKVIAISGKDRGAILPAGKTGTAYMYMSETGQFASSTYYMREHPAWVKEFHATKPADRYFHADWKPLLPEAAYSRSLPDNQKWYASGGSLPRKLGEGMDQPGPAFYATLLATPYGDALTLDFARAAIRGEQLGADGAPDILAVSLSTHDYVNHAYGAESRLSHDLTSTAARPAPSRRSSATSMRWSARLATCFVLTADHGFMPVPEYSRTQGHDAGRLQQPSARARMNRGWPASSAQDRGVHSRPRLPPGPQALPLNRGRSGGAHRGHAPTRAGRARHPGRVYACRARIGQQEGPAPLRGDAESLEPRDLRRRRLRVEALLADRVPRGRHDARLAAPLRHPRPDPLLRPRLGQTGPRRYARGGRGHRADAVAHAGHTDAVRRRGKAGPATVVQAAFAAAERCQSASRQYQPIAMVAARPRAV
jgi:predicted AlkP superfamily pyrophosphatase or phosphodiesterase